MTAMRVAGHTRFAALMTRDTAAAMDGDAASRPSTKRRRVSSARPDTRAELRGFHPNMLWLVRLRWIAVAGVSLALVVARATGRIHQLLAPLVVVGALALWNLWLSVRRRSFVVGLPSIARAPLERSVALEIHIDLLALTLLLHFTGGIENPFTLFYVFPIAIAAILLSLGRAVLVVVSACALYGALALGECTGVVDHYAIPFVRADTADPNPLWRSPLFLWGEFTALWITLVGTMYFVRSVVDRQRRTEELSREHERIAVSRERLARVGEISAGVAHSIRNPLHGVLNCCDLLDDGELDSSAAETLELMREGLRRIEVVTNRLLMLTRDAPLRMVPTDPGKELEEILRFAATRATERGVELRSELGELPRVILDRDRFHEAMFGILDNAIDACAAKGGGSVVVRCVRAGAPFDGICFEIRDDGIGIAKADLAKVFNPFFTTKAIGEGSGLGLAIARRIVEEHRGRIEVESELGEGTTVHVCLRRDPGARDEGGLR
jgi:signal transduction histidine kinase